MIIRRYNDQDYQEVYELVLQCQNLKLPEKLGGCGVVIEEEGRITAFTWALVAPDSEIACVEFFAVVEEKRGQVIYGPLVITALLKELRKLEKKTVIGFLVREEKYTESLIKIYHQVGMTANHGYIVNGNIEKVLDGIQQRYGGMNEFEDRTKN